MAIITLGTKWEDLHHLIRAIRENAQIYTSQLDRTGTADKRNVANLLGMVGALGVMGIHTAVRTDDLAKWLWREEDWFELTGKERK